MNETHGTTQASTVGETAARYCEQGLPITICKDKKPHGRGWDRNGESMGTDWLNYVWDVPSIERIFAQRTGLNVGLKLGPPSGVIDIEADSEEEERLFSELFEGCVIPVCPTFTSTRGKHRLFKWDDRFDALGKGLVKFNGSSKSRALAIRTGGVGKSIQSVIPPSCNRTWLVSLDECDPPALPEIVIERILATAMSKSIDVRIVQMPSVAPRNEPLGEQCLEENLPRRYRALHFPNLLRASDMVRRVTAADLVKREFDLAVLARLNRLGEKREQGETAWTL